ncbi:MAG: hypothetical protein ABI673_06615 [Novosphingobium sp.]
MLRLIIGAVLLATGGTSTATPPASPALIAATHRLQADDGRMQDIAFRLVTANASFCAHQQPTAGLLLLDVRNFSQPDAVRAALNIAGDFAVEAVAAGSPANKTGLKVGEEVVVVADLALASLPAARSGDFARLAKVHDRIDDELARHGALTIGLAGRSDTLPGVPACRSRFELLTDGDRAVADGARVLISREALARAASVDEAAFLLAHELAHNVLDHRARLDASGRSSAAVRQTEREADRLGLWLMANAGYNPAAAPAFMRRYGPKGLLALVQEPTHDRAPDRARMLEAELAVMASAPVDSAGHRDWRARFGLAGK